MFLKSSIRKTNGRPVGKCGAHARRRWKTLRPARRVIASSRRHVGDTGGRPTIRAWIVSAASVGITRRADGDASPDDHLTPRPHCSVSVSGVG
jgi:hypothetical protein